MTLSFFLLLAASGIFSYLGAQAKRTFHSRVRGLLPRNVIQNHLKVLFSEYPDRLPEFRAQALPIRAARLAFDGLSCVTLLVGLWFFPPVFLRGMDLSLLRFAGLALVVVACAVDVAVFCKMAYSTWTALGTGARKSSLPSSSADAESEA